MRKIDEFDEDELYIHYERAAHNNEEWFFGKNLFQFLYDISFIKETGNRACFYEPELKINVEDSSKYRFVYQIDIKNIHLELSRKLEKASDFIRRVHYANDWTEIGVNQNGVVKSIENIDELRSSWKKIKAKLINDYDGKAVTQYLVVP